MHSFNKYIFLFLIVTVFLTQNVYAQTEELDENIEEIEVIEEENAFENNEAQFDPVEEQSFGTEIEPETTLDQTEEIIEDEPIEEDLLFNEELDQETISTEEGEIANVPIGNQALSVARRLKINDEEPLQNGSIITVNEKGGYQLTRKAYDEKIVGVITENPALFFYTPPEDENTAIVSTAGRLQIRVNGEGGDILPGNKITSSNSPGVGMKANEEGFILGIAEEPFSPVTENEEGLIIVSVTQLSAISTNQVEIVKEKVQEATPEKETKEATTPIGIIKHIIAGFCIVISLILGFVTFTKSTLASIKAIGRNPAAKTAIAMNIILNVILTVIIVLVGAGIGYLILLI